MQILYFIHGHNHLEPFSSVTVTSDPVYSTTPNQGLSGGQIFCTVNQEKPQNSAVSILHRKLLIWLQKYYIHYTFKPNCVFLESTLPKEETKNRLKLCFTAQDNLSVQSSPVQSSVSRFWHRKHQPVQQGPYSCVVHEAAYVHDLLSYINNTELQTCLCTNSSCHGFLTNHMHADSWESILRCCNSSQLVLTLLPPSTVHDHGIIYTAQTHAVNVNLKLRLHIMEGPNFGILNVGNS